MKRQGGFTLIELIATLIVLAILAVTAAPKFLNFQNDAREAAINGLKGAIASAATLYYAKASLEGKEAAASETVVGVTVAYGYPVAGPNGIMKAVDGLQGSDDAANGTNDWVKLATAPAGAPAGAETYSFRNLAASVQSQCYVAYVPAGPATAAQTTVNCVLP